MDEAKKCRYCGAEVKKNAGFCSACGRELQDKPKNRKREVKQNLIPIVGFLAVFAAVYLVFSAVQQKAETGHRHSDLSSQPQGNADFDKLLSELPDDFEQLVGMGNGYMDDGIYAMAIVCYEKALSENPADADVMTDLGVCYHAIGNSENAIKTFEQVLELSPEHMITHFNLGIVYRDLNMPEKTGFYWKRLIEFHPKQPLADTVRKYIKLLDNS